MADGTKVDAGRAGVGGLAARPQCPKQMSRRSKFPDGVIKVICAIDSVIGADGDAVGTSKHPFAPGAQEVSIAIKDDYRMLAPVENKDTVLRIVGDTCDFRPTPTGG
ncbi:MAG: hypothetical protein NTZ30_19535 [Planctomycetota bacterium]|nr:hypothetical protein [Planctomycetota bacterium]